MKKYSAMVKDGKRVVIIRDQDYPNKAAFIHDLRANGYKVNPKKVNPSGVFDYICDHTDMNPWDWDLKKVPEEPTAPQEATPAPMKFKKQPNVAFFSKYVREDGKITITSVDRQINGTWKNVFEVTDESGTVIDVLPRLKDAKAKYETEQGAEAPVEAASQEEQAEEVQEAPKAAAEEAPGSKLNPMCEKCANYPTDCAGTHEQVWTGCVHRETAPDENKTFAPKKLRTMSDDQLLTAWEFTEHLEDPQCPTIRGWLMDEIERRYPVDFNAWLDQDAPEDSQLRHYVMGRG